MKLSLELFPFLFASISHRANPLFEVSLTTLNDLVVNNFKEYEDLKELNNAVSD